TNQHIEGNRNQLQRNENQDEINGRRHPHQSGAGEKWEREKFAETGLRCRASALNANRDRGREIEHHHQHAGGGGEGDPFKEKRERVGGVEGPEGSRRSRRLRREKERGDENHCQAKQGAIAEKTAVEL